MDTIHHIKWPSESDKKLHRIKERTRESHDRGPHQTKRKSVPCKKESPLKNTKRIGKKGKQLRPRIMPAGKKVKTGKEKPGIYPRGCVNGVLANRFLWLAGGPANWTPKRKNSTADGREKRNS